MLVRIPYTSVVSRILYEFCRTGTKIRGRPYGTASSLRPTRKSAWLLTHPAALPADLAAAASQPAAAAAPSPSSPVKCWSPTLAPSRAQFVKAGPASARQGCAAHVGSTAAQQLANSSLWLVKLRTTKLASIRSLSRTLRHTHCNLIMMTTSQQLFPPLPGFST